MKLASLVLALTAAQAGASVIGIDFGSAWMKVALVQLKVPLEIVPNTISKRKTEIAVAFDRGERLFGSDADQMLIRKPDTAYAHFREALGRKADHPLATNVKALNYGTQPYQNATRGGQNFGYAYKGEKGITSFSAEELSAMVFSYARDITKDFGGIAVRDAVITVPSFATAHERRALQAAAEIAGLKVLSLIEENTAAALQYGKDNVMENTTVLYYNMGASATQVSIVTYSNFTVKEGGKNKTVGTFEVVAKSWDATLGGESFDLTISDHFASGFAAKNGEGFKKNPKAVAKLRAQAKKTKEVLSANAEIPVKINSVDDDKDHSVLITRDQFEAMASGLLKRVTAPIDRALKAAGMVLSDLHAVEMLGGGQRIPAVQAVLGAYFGAATPLGVHLNADEAPALGAAFEAANISTAFKVRKTGMTDFSPFAVNVGLTSLPLVEEKGILGGLFSSKKTDEEVAAIALGDAWTKSTTVFKAWSRLESKKVIAFHHDRDLRVAVSYAPKAEGDEAAYEPLPEGTPLAVATFNVTGVSSFAKGMGEKGLKTCGSEFNAKPKVVLHFKLDSSGLVVLSKAEVSCEQVKGENATDAKEGAEGEDSEVDGEKKDDSEAASKDDKEAKKDEDKDGEKDEDSDKKDDTAAANETDEEKADRKKAEKKAKKEEKKKAEAEKAAKEKAEKAEAKARKEAKKKEKADLEIVEDFSGAEVKAVSPNAIAESKAKLAHLQLADDLRFAKLAAKNDLEAFLYAVKNKMEDEGEAIGLVTTEEQREALLAAVSEALGWLEEEGYDADAVEYKAKKSVVTALVDPVYFRLDEATARPEAVAMGEKRLKDIRLLVAKWEEKMPQVTEAERGDVIALVEKAEAWLEGKVADQAKLAGHEPPAFTAAEVSAALKPTANLVTKLSRKPKPKPIVVNATNSTNSTNATDANSTDANATEGGGAEGEATAEEVPPLEEEGAEKAEDKDEL